MMISKCVFGVVRSELPESPRYATTSPAETSLPTTSVGKYAVIRDHTGGVFGLYKPAG